MESDSDEECFVVKKRQKSAKKNGSASQKNKNTQNSVQETSTSSQKGKRSQKNTKKSTAVVQKSQETNRKKIASSKDKLVPIEEDSKKIESLADLEGTIYDDTIESIYCPTCQAPLHYLKISPEVHASSCAVDWSSLPECPEGPNCVCDTIFHYRDFSHKLLAEFRSTKNYVSPRVKRRTVSKSRTKRALSSSKKAPSISGDAGSSNNGVGKVKRKLDYNEPGPSGKKRRSRPSEASSETITKAIKSEPITSDEETAFKKGATLRSESQVHSTACSAPSQSDAPDYLLANLIGTEIKTETVESYEIFEDPYACGLFESSQNLQSSQASCQNSSSAKEQTRTSQSHSRNNSPPLCRAEDFQDLPFSHSLSSGRSNIFEPSISIDESEHPIKQEVCSEEYQENAGLNGKDVDDLDMAQFDEEFERCFDKYSETESHRNQESPVTFNPSGDDSSNVSCDESDMKSSRSSKNQENSKSLWKQILKPKTQPLQINNSAPTTGKVRYDRFSKTRVVINHDQRKDLNAPLNRTCPFYKKIPDTSFVVDAFSYGIIPGVTSYFLSHFHADHYIGLRKSFNKPIYCSKITASLVNMKIGVKEEFLRILNLREPRIINGVEVTVFDANQLTDNRQYLHVGDFRACREMESEPILKKACITALFLDTTYCNPQYTFPLQRDIIRMVVDVVKKKVSECPHLLVACGSYTIGKEKVFLGILDEFTHWKLWAQQPKQRILHVLENDLISSKLVSSPHQANVHVLSMKDLNFQALSEHLSKVRGSFTHVLAFKPTGWEMGRGKKFDVLNHTSHGNITIYGVPYSEHSSYSELCRFTQFIAPEKVIPTVNVGNAVMRKKMEAMIDGWLKKPKNKAEQKSLKSFF